MIFKKRIYAKWILSGEHSVLRSHPALAFPLKHFYIDFTYEETNEKLKILHEGQSKTGLDFSFLPLFEEALSLVGKGREDLKGSLQVDSHIPFGAGLGASAILSIACALLFEYKTWIKKSEIVSTAKKLEDLFHKTSSGLDVVAVLEQKPLLFQNGQIKKYLDDFKNKPSLYLSYSGRRSSTSFGISKVAQLFKNKKDSLDKVDQEMTRSVELCLSAGQQEEAQKMISLLQEGLNVGEKCFKDLGLISGDLESHSRQLKDAGALATKPTGSGLGGYVISLWDKEPPADLGIEFFPLSV